MTRAIRGLDRLGNDDIEKAIEDAWVKRSRLGDKMLELDNEIRKLNAELARRKTEAKREGE